MVNKPKVVIHASNILGLGASNVSISLINSISRKYDSLISEYILPTAGPLQNLLVYNPKVNRFKRCLPNVVSRFIECTLSHLFFDKEKYYIILGDLPLYGIYNQVVLVHQPNLVCPKVNPHSSNSLTFRVNRFLFKRNLRFTKKIIVQTSVMKKDLLASYPELKDRIEILPQPLPDNFGSVNENIKIKKNETFSLFYPAAGYSHKNHDFLFRIAEELKNKDINFMIHVTLENHEFKRFNKIKFLKNIGRIPSAKMKETYLKYDALLFISRAESYGLPLVEAMSLGMPIVTIDLQYSRWMCEDGANYFVEDDVKSFLNALHDARTQSFNKTKHQSALKKFPTTWEVIADKFIQEAI